MRSVAFLRRCPALASKRILDHTAAIPFDSDAPNAAAYKSASALLLAMTFCLRVYAFQRVTAEQYHACT